MDSTPTYVNITVAHLTLTDMGNDTQGDVYYHSSNYVLSDNNNNNNVSGIVSITVEKQSGYLTDHARMIFELVNFVGFTFLVSVCGMITNIINFIVFLRQGLTDSITLSLLGLAVSDFGACTTNAWVPICLNPLFEESGIPFNSPTVQYLTGGWPHVCFARITSFITAYITFERCLCIVMPLKVKNIITPRRTSVVILMIYVMIIASVSPVYFVIRLDWVFNEDKNRTLVDLVYGENGVNVENVSLLFNACSQIISVVLVIIFSLFLVNRLRQKTRWRQKSSSASADGDGNTSSSSSSASSRDHRVVKMVLIVAGVFIVCYLPSATNLIIMTTSEEYSIVGRYKNMFQTVWSFLNILESLNSAVNIVVYYRMSSKYRGEFRKLFCLTPEDDK